MICFVNYTDLPHVVYYNIECITNAQYSMHKIVIIAARALNDGIGKGNQLLFPNQKADMRHFKELTTGHTVVMGRNTFESLNNKPLKNRRNIVLSKTLSTNTDGIEVMTSVEDVLNSISDNETVFIIGGSQIYKLFIEYAHEMELTTIFEGGQDADTFFPEFERGVWRISSSKVFDTDSENEYPYMFQKFIKK